MDADAFEDFQEGRSEPNRSAAVASADNDAAGPDNAASDTDAATAADTDSNAAGAAAAATTAAAAAAGHDAEAETGYVGVLAQVRLCARTCQRQTRR